MLRDVLECNPRINAIGYDDACHFAPHVRNRYKDSDDEVAARMADSTQVDYFVDPFHFKGHTGFWCRKLYNPHDRRWLPALNSQAAEHTWTWLNKYRFMVRSMSVLSSELLLLRVSWLHNFRV